MSMFLRLLFEGDKAEALSTLCTRARAGIADERVFFVEPSCFHSVPGSPFAYWVSEDVRGTFKRLHRFEDQDRATQHGASTKDDFRFLRLWWESVDSHVRRVPFAKGGRRSSFYSDINSTILWESDAKELEAALLKKYPYLGNNANWILHRECNYFASGLTWPLRGVRFSSQLVPAGCVFSVAGKMAFVPGSTITTWLALFNSSSFDYLVRMYAGKVGGVQYEIGLIGGIPVPEVNEVARDRLGGLACQGWSHMRRLASVNESSHAFVLPAALRDRLGDYDPLAIEAELSRIQAEIDAIAFDLYGFSEADRAAVQASQAFANEDDAEVSADEEVDDEDSAEPVAYTDGLRSWALGVAFGRFDWRLAAGERAAPPEPEPFDPLPVKSPGMLPDGTTPFHAHAGILVDDPGHPHDLVRLTEEVLARVHAPMPGDLRRWLQKDFFPFHLQRYSKSRRKAPIYWPLTTVSGSYTLWVYYPSLSRQTLYTAINDFVDPKLKQVRDDVAALRNKGTARTRDDEKQFETLQTLAQELSDLRDSLQGLAHGYQPHHDDGVQISAAPLWPLFRHKPWQKLLKDTWTKLEKGDYDWARLAMAYWPARVREKCKTDKSLAIAHGLEDLYIEPKAAPKKTRGRQKADA